ncbi:hypothetical protein ACFXHA_16770 [Nocardia sp. NPDC059240]|uniref:hypothetical protein n=1 Tax=Nocardia sp. NPDC059240 TaxID=3346786 RepID=UPI0036931CD6
MRTRTSARALAAAGITAAASTLTVLSAGTAAHADVVGTGMTVQGSNFQAGQTYNVVVPVSGCSAPGLSDTVGGVTVRSGWAVTSSMAAGTPCSGTTSTETIQWTPLVPGTHVLGLGYGNNNANLPPYTNLGTATVEVGGGASTDPESCGNAASTLCTTVHGTPEAGCALTVTISNIPASLAASSGSAVLSSLSAGSTVRNAWVVDNGTNTGTTAINGNSVSFKWTPAAAGLHHLTGQYDTGAQPGFLSDAVIFPGFAGEMWLPVAAAGTQPCA